MRNGGGRKTNEFVKLAQKWGIPILQISFIIGVIVTVIGAFSKSKMFGRGIFVMLISLIIFCFIKYAPMAYYAFQAWLKH